ncbi:biopolymer transporter [Malaciobacter molluscorum LMG 25693]|uniref:Biopolymer transporter n=1 Tax=Malaciobacter molluscorum LMG 25693 TaxID=870501 RepID=A0A2G1DHQ9_9BACT|nr:MotA/TolQ/ExbB proton channel family protein [Malaciobacter molluscorum]AXX92968.1 Tol-Pal system subunit TolQ [Malaciobacter molluscorum LMG 25693]PHO18025.1 biopolymer transporter [Malaciobacter molluscorum LMG 25693]RXJ94918.1 biopolymer transporter [Malaciobacter molluscorum]
MIDLILDYLSNSSAITILVLVLLSAYLVTIFWIFIYRLLNLNSLIVNEQKSLDTLTSRGTDISPLSSLYKCSSGSSSKHILHACEISIIKDASFGISWLSIISSTAPFIGLFGTVVGILESFAKFSNQGKVGFSVIAPAISEALVATAAGIFVAIFAYTFHQILVRKVYELNTYIKAQAEILVAKG